jgi:hypothetical protein
VHVNHESERRDTEGAKEHFSPTLIKGRIAQVKCRLFYVVHRHIIQLILRRYCYETSATNSCTSFAINLVHYFDRLYYVTNDGGDIPLGQITISKQNVECVTVF